MVPAEALVVAARAAVAADNIHAWRTLPGQASRQCRKLQAVFQNAADLDAGQCEDDSIFLEALGFQFHQIGRFGGEGNNGSIGVDSAALDLSDLIDAVLVRNADCGEFLALFREHLDALIEAAEVTLAVINLFVG